MDDALIFAPEGLSEPNGGERPWKILISDDEPSVHLVTKLALGEFSFEGRPLLLLSAYGEDDTRRLLGEHPDTALVLLDVVMDTITSGFDLVRHVREVLKNPDIRIIMRTGQSGNAPEDRIIIDYDINDFKDKTELTVAKLRTAMISSLRTYSRLQAAQEDRRRTASQLAFLRAAINLLSSPVIALDQTLRITLWNWAAERTLEAEESALLGKVLFEAVPALRPLRAALEQAAEFGGYRDLAVELEGSPGRSFRVQINPDALGPVRGLLLQLDPLT